MKRILFFACLLAIALSACSTTPCCPQKTTSVACEPCPASAGAKPVAEPTCPVAPPAAATPAAAAPVPCPPPPPPVVEVRQQPQQQQDIQVQMPAPKIIINTPAPQTITLPAQQPVLTQPPQMPQLASYGMQAIPAGAQVTQIPTGRARLGLTLDSIRIPIPIPRFIAVPTTPEVVLPAVVGAYGATPAAFPTMPMAAAPMMQAAYAQPVQPMMMQPQMMQPQMMAAAYQQPVQTMQPMMMPAPMVAPAAPPAMLPVQGQLTVPVAGQVPAHLLGQAAVAPTLGAVPPAAPAVALDPRTAAEYCRQVEALKAALDASAKAMGCQPK